MKNHIIYRDREIDYFVEQNIDDMKAALDDLKSSFQIKINSLDSIYY